MDNPLKARTKEWRAYVQSRFTRQHERIAELEREVRRLSPQVAAIEERLADLTETLQRLEPRPAIPADASLEEVRSMWEEIQAEHAKIRARVSASARFEERLRLVEVALTGDDSVS